MLEWLFIWNDPNGQVRLSVVITAIVFWLVIVGFTIAIRAVLLRQFRAQLEGFSRWIGYTNTNDFLKDITAETLNMMGLFVMLLTLVYFFSFKAEITQSYDCFAYASAVQQCIENNMTLSCIHFNANQLTGNQNYELPNITNLPGGKGWHSDGEIQYNDTHKPIQNP